MDVLDRGARISDELIAIAEAARQRLSDLPDDYEGTDEDSPAAAVTSKPSRPRRLQALAKRAVADIS